MLNQFKQIILEDQKRIYEVYPGIILTLYYLARIYQSSGFIIEWMGFEKLVDYYNGEIISDKIFRGQDNEIMRLLFNYISPKECTDDGEKNLYVCFNHDLLVEEGFTQKMKRHWDYNREVFNQMLWIFDQYRKDETIREVQWRVNEAG